MTLISTEWLNNNLSKVKIFDASWHMPNSNRNSHKEYLGKHIPGAMFWDLDEHSDKDSPFPHMLPNSDYWTRMLWSFGVKNNDHIIVYDFSDVHSACRLWFSLKYFGHQKVSVLDGGMKKWLLENKPTTNKINKIERTSSYRVSENVDWIKNKKQIDENIKNEKEMEQIVLSDVPNEIYPRLEDLFISLVNKSGFPEVKIERKVDFEKLYKERLN